MVRGAFRHVVQQGLPGRADHRDDVRAGAGGAGGLHDVLVDVAGRDDQVDPRPLRRVAVLRDELVALRPVAGRPSAARARRRSARPRAARSRVTSTWDGVLDLPGGGRLGQLGQRGEVVLAQRVEGRQHHAVLEAAVLADGVDHPVHPRHVAGAVGGVGAGDAGEAQRGALDGDRGVRSGDLDHRLGSPRGELARGRDHLGIKVQQSHYDTLVNRVSIQDSAQARSRRATPRTWPVRPTPSTPPVSPAATQPPTVCAANASSKVSPEPGRAVVHRGAHGGPRVDRGDRGVRAERERHARPRRASRTG